MRAKRTQHLKILVRQTNRLCSPKCAILAGIYNLSIKRLDEDLGELGLSELARGIHRALDNCSPGLASMQRHVRSGRLTWAEKAKRTIKVIFVEVAQDQLVLVHHLLVRTEDDEQEARIPLPDLTRVPLGRILLLNIASDVRCDCGSCR
jgi:hypothetical protein